MEELRACPFCGGERSIIPHIDIEGEKGLLQCDSCGANGQTVTIKNGWQTEAARYLDGRRPPLDKEIRDKIERGKAFERAMSVE